MEKTIKVVSRVVKRKFNSRPGHSEDIPSGRPGSKHLNVEQKIEARFRNQSIRREVIVVDVASRASFAVTVTC